MEWTKADTLTAFQLTFHWCFKVQWKAFLCQEALPEGLMAVVRGLEGG